MNLNTDFIKQLRDSGLRPTKQRLKICKVLFDTEKTFHFTINDLVKIISEKLSEKISLATVYNTLKTFCDAGLIQEIIVDGSKSYFDTKTYDHPHFYWEDEAKLTDAPLEDLEIARLPDAPNGTRITSVNVVIRLKNEIS